MGEYKNGVKDGKFIVYWDNGQIKKECEFNYGKKVGKYIAYYDNGQIRIN